jgi:phosphoglycolate phosphatase
MKVATSIIVFDLDGTLVDTAPEIIAATNDFLEHHDWPMLAADEITRFIGRGTRALLYEVIAKASGRTPVDVAAMKDFPDYIAVFDRYYSARCGTSSTLFPGVKATLEVLKEHALHLSVVTNKNQDHALRVLDAHGLRRFFDPIIGGDTLATRKPDPEGLLACLAKNNAAPHEALFIGDSSVDATTARNAGVACWLLPYGYNMGKPSATAGSDRLLDDFPSIADGLFGNRMANRDAL